MSLVWLPLSVSADTTISSTNKNNCHEMNSTMRGHDMSTHSMNSAMSSQVAVTDNAMHESMMQKDHCDNCDNDCTSCISMTSCGHSSNHVSACIIFNKDISLSQKNTQSSFEHIVQYHSQIITPDFRPPIV
jgi:hypothetical protein